eukprot:CAMPEP_0172175312 /NCGR_PEP_ID=MMETSP1050-20130122/14154_1 /TAXON_ID=233186 /ORGANISM="Cryptomonas curvata, Strain CCAP979/52" /LENGTH=66 /DNA_ID=CAMNT_0012847393 /DNA_START=708 /DNA_END=908 /DNA_ORIENTATION=+
MGRSPDEFAAGALLSAAAAAAAAAFEEHALIRGPTVPPGAPPGLAGPAPRGGQARARRADPAWPAR